MARVGKIPGEYFGKPTRENCSDIWICTTHFALPQFPFPTGFFRRLTFKIFSGFLRALVPPMCSLSITVSLNKLLLDESDTPGLHP